MKQGFGTPKTTSITGRVPPVPSFRGGRLDTPADAGARHHSKMFPSPQRIKVQAAIERVQQIQERIKAASSEKQDRVAEVEKILASQSDLTIPDQEAQLRTATSGSTGSDYRTQARAWTCLAKLAQKQNCPERAISYLQEALIHKAQPKQQIEEGLRDLYVQNGGSLSDLLNPPDNLTDDDDPMEATPVTTPITNKLMAILQEHDRHEHHLSTALHFGTPRAEKISLLKTKPSKPYVETDTPSPTPAQIIHLSEMLEKAYIEGPPLNLPEKENVPVKNPFDGDPCKDALLNSPAPEKSSNAQMETPNTVRRVRRSLRLAKRLDY